MNELLKFMTVVCLAAGVILLSLSIRRDGQRIACLERGKACPNLVLGQ